MTSSLPQSQLGGQSPSTKTRSLQSSINISECAISLGDTDLATSGNDIKKKHWMLPRRKKKSRSREREPKVTELSCVVKPDSTLDAQTRRSAPEKTPSTIASSGSKARRGRDSTAEDSDVTTGTPKEHAQVAQPNPEERQSSKSIFSFLKPHKTGARTQQIGHFRTAVNHHKPQLLPGPEQTVGPDIALLIGDEYLRNSWSHGGLAQSISSNFAGKLRVVNLAHRTSTVSQAMEDVRSYLNTFATSSDPSPKIQLVLIWFRTNKHNVHVDGHESDEVFLKTVAELVLLLRKYEAARGAHVVFLTPPHLDVGHKGLQKHLVRDFKTKTGAAVMDVNEKLRARASPYQQTQRMVEKSYAGYYESFFMTDNVNLPDEPHLVDDRAVTQRSVLNNEANTVLKDALYMLLSRKYGFTRMKVPYAFPDAYDILMSETITPLCKRDPELFMASYANSPGRDFRNYNQQERHTSLFVGDSHMEHAWQDGGLLCLLQDKYGKHLEILTCGGFGYNTTCARIVFDNYSKYLSTQAPKQNVRFVFIWLGLEDSWHDEGEVEDKEKGKKRPVKCIQHVPVETYKENLSRILDCAACRFPDALPVVFGPIIKVEGELSSDLRAVHSNQTLTSYSKAAESVASLAHERSQAAGGPGVLFVNHNSQIIVAVAHLKYPLSRYVNLQGLELTKHAHKTIFDNFERQLKGLILSF